MATKDICSVCKGSGRILLLFTWASCPECEKECKSKEKSSSKEKKKKIEPFTNTKGRIVASRFDDIYDPSYFDDGLDAYDYINDDDWWEADDS